MGPLVTDEDIRTLKFIVGGVFLAIVAVAVSIGYMLGSL